MFFKFKQTFSILLILITSCHAQTCTKTSDPYKWVPLVTNTIQWPYDMSDYGTSTFIKGSLESENADTLLLNNAIIKGFHFPSSFSFGTACAAYQYEGNRVQPTLQNPYGVGWSIWDVFSEPGSWLNPSGTNIQQALPTSLYTLPNGSQAIEGFKREFYSQDLELIKELGTDFYRLSISWPRLFPRPNMTIPDPDGINYYISVLELAKQKHLKVLITLYHWDLPAWLYNFGETTPLIPIEKTYGWIDMSKAKDNTTLKEFQKYVAASYYAFGPYTSYFSTFNEPLSFTNNAFNDGVNAPGQYGWEILQRLNPTLYGSNHSENLQKIPYLQAINIVKAHYIAYKTMHFLYSKDPKHYLNFAPNVNIVLHSDWAEPYRVSKSIGKNGHVKLEYNLDDIAASKKNMDFMLGWWLNPVMFGTWPKSMQFIYDTRIPSVGLLKDQDDSCLQDNGTPVSCDSGKNLEYLADYVSSGGALDSLAINHYTGYFVADLNYAKANISPNPVLGAVPPNQYQANPNALLPGWYSDQDNYMTQFRYYLYGDQGSAPTVQDSVFIIGNAGNKPWLRQTYFAYRKLLQYINQFYLQVEGKTKQNLPFSALGIYLTENGTSEYQESQKTENQLVDKNRIEFILGNLAAVEQAVTEDRINVKLYTYWSIADNFEWADAYDSRFGIVWIDYQNNFQRMQKNSYYCYQDIIAHKSDGSPFNRCVGPKK